MPTQLVDDVRTRLRDEGRPLTALERTLLMATVISAPRDPAGTDVVDHLETTIRTTRGALAVDTDSEVRRTALRDLIQAARAVLDHVPPDRTIDPALLVPSPRPWRADVDG